MRRKRIRRVLVIGGIGVATLGIGYLAWRHFGPKPMETDEPGGEGGGKPHNLPRPQDDPPHADPPSGGGGGGTGTFRPDTNFPLTIYTKGDKVRNIQKALNYKFKAGLVVDGEWGQKTEAALKANGQPTSITKAQYDFLLDAMRRLGLAGPGGNVGRMALTLRPCTARTQQGTAVRVDGAWLAGSVFAEEGGKSDVVTSGGNLLTFDTRDLTFA